MLDLENALAIMKNAAINAGDVLRELQPKSIRLPSRKDFLTDADLRSEEIILRVLADDYPDIPALSEESGGDEREDGHLWVIDPVDGTLNFFLQDDLWGVSIALVENGQTVAGVIYFPARRQLFSTSHDSNARVCYFEGHRTRWEDLKVNRVKDFAEAQFWLSWGKEESGGDDHKRVFRVLANLDHHSLYPQIRNCGTWEMMMVACGKITGHVFPKPEPFDIAAAGLIVERAGGIVTDMEGNPWGPFSRSTVASNGIIHPDLLRILKM